MQAQAVHDQLPRKRAVFGADADRPEQGGVLAVAADVGTDTLPQQIQRLWIALVARLHERATHFQTGAEAVEKSAIVAEQLAGIQARSEEHTSELQSLMRISYAVFCLTKKKTIDTITMKL